MTVTEGGIVPARCDHRWTIIDFCLGPEGRWIEWWCKLCKTSRRIEAAALGRASA